MTRDGSRPSVPYILGHSEHELARIRKQAILLEPITTQYLREAGITTGMRVLDVGSGLGDVARIAAELVGETGEVIGTDSAARAVEVATRVAQERDLRNVEFRTGDPTEMEFGDSFDAVVGRYVLPFQSDASSMLLALSRHLSPGGRLVFHEPDWGSVRSLPPAPLYDQACRWIVDTTGRSGQSWNFLDQAYPAFARAGLPSPTLRMHTHVVSSPHCRAWLMAVADMIESLLPTMQAHDVATAEEVDLPTLRNRLWEEATSSPGVLVGRSEIGMWTIVD